MPSNMGRILIRERLALPWQDSNEAKDNWLLA
jgi:hypothetical protein